MRDEDTKTIIAHGVDHVVYANGPNGLRPYIECLCGWGVVEDDWETVGRELDQHLKLQV